MAGRFRQLTGRYLEEITFLPGSDFQGEIFFNS